MTDSEAKLLASLKSIPPMTRAQAKAKLCALVNGMPALDRRHASGELERCRQERYQADINTLLEAIDAIPDGTCSGCGGQTDPKFPDAHDGHEDKTP